MTTAFASPRDFRPRAPREDAGRALAVALGTRVTVRRGILVSDLWIVADEEEPNAPRGRVAADSPLGRALVGARVGGSVEYQAGGRTEEIHILAIALA